MKSISSEIQINNNTKTLEKLPLKASVFIAVIMKPRFQIIFFIAWFCLIVVLSIIPDNSPDTIKINTSEFRLDYLKHFLVYLPLGFFLLSIKKNGYLLTISLALFVVSLPEILQYFIPYRAYNPIDLLANLVGVIGGIVIYTFITQKFSTVK